jgi:hypothetical protein
MHGIERTKKRQGPPGQDVGVRGVVIRYTDGRVMNFVPDAGREMFSEDDMLKLQEILVAASSVAEWAEATEREGL